MMANDQIMIDAIIQQQMPNCMGQLVLQVRPKMDTQAWWYIWHFKCKILEWLNLVTINMTTHKKLKFERPWHKC